MFPDIILESGYFVHGKLSRLNWNYDRKTELMPVWNGSI